MVMKKKNRTKKKSLERQYRMDVQHLVKKPEKLQTLLAKSKFLCHVSASFREGHISKRFFGGQKKNFLKNEAATDYLSC